MKYYRPLSIVLLCLLVTCNIILRIPAKPYVNPKLKPYVQTFQMLCEKYKADCSKLEKFNIDLVSMDSYDLLYKMIGAKGKVIGHCFREANEIDIRIDYFENSLPAEIEQLVIHELGHCILDLEHTEDTEIAIMNPYSLYYNAYKVHYNELMNRFFSCETFCPVIEFNESNY